MAKRVLVVEDSADLAMLLRLSLGAAGYRVRWARDLGRARAWLARPWVPDIVILGDELADGSGLDLLRPLKARHPLLPVLLLMGWVTPAACGEALAAGADALLPMPFLPDDVEGVVGRLLPAA